jgi:2-C-methyl-D-erythritol 4-phosphate cytidylyltransferase
VGGKPELTQTTERLAGRVVAVIVAAGEIVTKGGFDRIFGDLAGKPVLAHSIAAFERCPAVNEIVLVASQANLSRCWKLAKDEGWTKLTKIVPGGARRQDSVSAGLQEIGECELVLIHDGSRPLVSADLIVGCMECAREHGAAILAVPIRDAVKMVSTELMVRATPDRSTLWLAQTPQCFRKDLIIEAYRGAFGDVSDDSVLVERQNHPVKVCLGAYSNVKISAPEDLEFAQALIAGQAVP